MRGFFFIYPMKVIGIHNGINWKRQPLVRPLILFIAGLLSAQIFSKFLLIIVTIFFALICVLLVQSQKRFLNRSIVSFIIYASFFLAGVCLYALHFCSVGDIPEFKNVTLLVKQSSEPVYKENNHEFKSQCIVEAKAIYAENLWRDISGTIKINLKNDSLTSAPGELLLLHANFKKPSNEILPGSFDFERFCMLKSIEAICTIKKHQLLPLGKIEQGFFSNTILTIRRSIISYLKSSGFDVNQLGIASALLVGYRADIESELNSAYSKAGIVHVLAVSGMHVSLVFGSVLWLLGRFLKPRNAALVGILVLWFYALLAGLSASVLRSACMFSLLAIAKLLVNSTVSSNAMAGAAFIMLCLDPQALYDPGAQLSFAAVWGIYARSSTPSILFFKNKLMRYVVDSLWVCLVAQLATLPITLWYFGSFPVYFLLANLIAVPFSTGLIYVGFIGLLLAPFGSISVPFLELLKIGIDVMNGFTRFIAGLPLSSIDFGRFALMDAFFIASIIYIVLFPIGSIRMKLFVGAIVRLIHSVAFMLASNRVDNSPDLYFFSCERMYHFVCVENSSVRLVNYGSETHHACKRVIQIELYAQAEGHELVIENQIIQNTASGGTVKFTYFSDDGLNRNSLLILPASPFLNLPLRNRFTSVYCRQFEPVNKAQFMYSSLIKRRVLPIGNLNSYKIR